MMSVDVKVIASTGEGGNIVLSGLNGTWMSDHKVPLLYSELELSGNIGKSMAAVIGVGNNCCPFSCEIQSMSNNTNTYDKAASIFIPNSTRLTEGELNFTVVPFFLKDAGGNRAAIRIILQGEGPNDRIVVNSVNFQNTEMIEGLSSAALSSVKSSTISPSRVMFEGRSPGMLVERGQVYLDGHGRTSSGNSKNRSEERSMSISSLIKESPAASFKAPNSVTQNAEFLRVSGDSSLKDKRPHANYNQFTSTPDPDRPKDNTNGKYEPFCDMMPPRNYAPVKSNLTPQATPSSSLHQSSRRVPSRECEARFEGVSSSRRFEDRPRRSDSDEFGEIHNITDTVSKPAPQPQGGRQSMGFNYDANSEEEFVGVICSSNNANINMNANPNQNENNCSNLGNIINDGKKNQISDFNNNTEQLPKDKDSDRSSIYEVIVKTSKVENPNACEDDCFDMGQSQLQKESRDVGPMTKEHSKSDIKINANFLTETRSKMTNSTPEPQVTTVGRHDKEIKEYNVSVRNRSAQRDSAQSSCSHDIIGTKARTRYDTGTTGPNIGDHYSEAVTFQEVEHEKEHTYEISNVINVSSAQKQTRASRSRGREDTDDRLEHIEIVDATPERSHHSDSRRRRSLHCSDEEPNNTSGVETDYVGPVRENFGPELTDETKKRGMVTNSKTVSFSNTNTSRQNSVHPKETSVQPGETSKGVLYKRGNSESPSSSVPVESNNRENTSRSERQQQQQQQRSQEHKQSSSVSSMDFSYSSSEPPKEAPPAAPPTKNFQQHLPPLHSTTPQPEPSHQSRPQSRLCHHSKHPSTSDSTIEGETKSTNQSEPKQDLDSSSISSSSPSPSHSLSQSSSRHTTTPKATPTNRSKTSQQSQVSFIESNTDKRQGTTDRSISNFQSTQGSEHIVPENRVFESIEYKAMTNTVVDAFPEDESGVVEVTSPLVTKEMRQRLAVERVNIQCDGSGRPPVFYSRKVGPTDGMSGVSGSMTEIFAEGLVSPLKMSHLSTVATPDLQAVSPLLIRQAEQSLNISGCCVSNVIDKARKTSADPSGERSSIADVTGKELRSPIFLGRQRNNQPSHLTSYFSEGETGALRTVLNFPDLLRLSPLLLKSFGSFVNTRFTVKLIVQDKFGFETFENMSMALKVSPALVNLVGEMAKTGGDIYGEYDEADLGYSISIKNQSRGNAICFKPKPHTFERLRYGYADMRKADKQLQERFSLNKNIVSVVFKPGTRINKKEVVSLLMEFKNPGRARVVSSLFQCLKYSCDQTMVELTPYGQACWGILKRYLQKPNF